MLNRKKIILYSLIFLIVALVVIGSVYVLTRDDKDIQSEEESNEEIIITQEDLFNSSQTHIDILKSHNTKEDCWVAKDGKVYELTSILLTLDEVEISDCGTVIERELPKTDLDLMEVYYMTNLRKEDL